MAILVEAVFGGTMGQNTKTKLIAVLLLCLCLAGHGRADEALPEVAQWLAAPAQTRAEIAVEIVAQTRHELDVIVRLGQCETTILLGGYPDGVFYWILNGTLQEQINRIRMLLWEFDQMITQADQQCQWAATLHGMYLAEIAGQPLEYQETVTMVYMEPILAATRAAREANAQAWQLLRAATENLQALEAALAP